MTRNVGQGRNSVKLRVESHWEIFSRFLSEGQAVGALVMDAHLAALAVEHGATLATTDRDFARFADLQTFNPIAQVR